MSNSWASSDQNCAAVGMDISESLDPRTAKLDDTNPKSITQDLVRCHKARYKGLDDVYLEFWPIGCKGPSQTPNWELFDRKLGRFLNHNEKIREATTSARTLHIMIKCRNVPGDSLAQEPQPESSASDSKIEIICPDSIKERHGSSEHNVNTNYDQFRNESGSEYDWPSPETPTFVPALDESWTIVADELHSARTILCLTMDCGDNERMDAPHEEGKLSKSSES